MKPIFKEESKDDDSLSTMTALTPLSPFTLLYLRSFPTFSGFSLIAEAQILKSNELKESLTTCKCSKTKCLKLYCDCFSQGKYCKDCNCKDCHNNLDHKEERDLIIEKTKIKNPGAFRVDISDNYKICHCTKSFCLKKYCECLQNNKACNPNCKCKQCKNLANNNERS
jgi:Tesmin/TSO1-like CXC domain, cysteine-rich domain